MNNLDGYLGAVIDRLQGIFRGRLVGVYPAGSLAFDAYQPGRSDVDLLAVAEEPTAEEIAAVVAALGHAALPCPATGLEFVLYDRATLAGLSIEAGFALNLNTGAELPYKAETDPGDGLTFWYPIDRDMVRQQRRALIGPPFAGLAPRVRSRVLLPVVAESVAVQLAHLGEHGDNAVLNACRALRYHAERTWSPKRAAAVWAVQHLPGGAEVIQAALDSHAVGRDAGRSVDRAAATQFLTRVHAILAGSAPDQAFCP
ncbi:aminoglycoside adenylyltransferase domain-containing protein [Dactylosporangium sp. NPDC048998]|uniref:aminoglycoside adenylyltransferase domain-containing protein n=1 Tax=Dactylosporangium sp. NPDC048998 TaxID=3363976 RepID=UPI00371F553C